MMNKTTSLRETVGWQGEARHVAQAIRLRVLEHTILNNGGYLSQACSSAEILATLYTRIMNLGPSTAPAIPPPFPGVPGPHNPDYFTGVGYNGPKAPHLDRFILSPVHYALVLYATLIEVGRMDPKGLVQFNQDGSTVEMIGAEHSPGLEVTAGSLSQGLSQAAGITMARKRKGETGRTWVFMSDGEFQEGQTWEAFEALSYYHLDKVGVYVDVNRQQCDGAMSSVMSIEPLAAKMEAFGARVFQVDGHVVEALAAPAELEPDGRPLVVLCYTDPCSGLEDLRSRGPKLHYVRFKDEHERQLFDSRLHEMQQDQEGSGPDD